jgi:hypothetical protein
MPLSETSGRVIGQVQKPHLAILALDDLLVHEWYDEERTAPLADRILQTGVFRHPPVVIPLGDGSGQYVVLDGANRVAALRSLHCPHLVAQVVHHGDPGLRLRTWNHVLLDAASYDILEALRRIPELDIASSDATVIELPSRREVGVALLQTLDGRVYGLSAPAADLPGRIFALNAIVDSYKSWIRMDRTPYSNLAQLDTYYLNLSALVIFPKFDLKEILSMAAVGCLLPAGITRITVSPRALYINYPLSELASAGSSREKEHILQALIRQRFSQGKIRYIEEEIFLFDE